MYDVKCIQLLLSKRSNAKKKKKHMDRERGGTILHFFFHYEKQGKHVQAILRRFFVIFFTDRRDKVPISTIYETLGYFV